MSKLPQQLRTQERLGAVLAFVAGYVDGFGLLAWGTFLSFMSGNTTRAGSDTGLGHFSLAVPPAIAIVAFTVGVCIGHMLTAAARQPTRLIVGLVGLLLLAAGGALKLGLLPHLVAVGELSVAMGILNSALSRLGSEHVNLAFVTGTLNKIGAHLAQSLLGKPLKDSQGDWDTHLGRIYRLSFMCAAFLVGALLAGLLGRRLGSWTLFPPGVVLLAISFLPRVVGEGAASDQTSP